MGAFCLLIFGRCSDQNKLKHDNRALVKAKYCPPVAAALCTQKNTKKTSVTSTVDLWPRNSLDFVGCQGTCSCKISSSWAQRFVMLTERRNSDENNTVRRCRADSNKTNEPLKQLDKRSNIRGAGAAGQLPPALAARGQRGGRKLPFCDVG